MDSLSPGLESSLASPQMMTTMEVEALEGDSELNLVTEVWWSRSMDGWDLALRAGGTSRT